MHDSSTTPAEDSGEPEFDHREPARTSREARQRRYLMIGVTVLAVATLFFAGWRFFASSTNTDSCDVDPVNQACAEDIEPSTALGGAPAPNDSFWDGTHIIGEDSVLPGTYQSTGNGTCYWARLSGTTGADDEVISSNQSTNGPQTVTILQTDVAFTSMGCGEWRAVGD